MSSLKVREEDLNESYYRPAGKGARSRKALTGVCLIHKPTGIQVRCNRERSQGINRFIARRSLVEELEARERNMTRHQVKAEQLRDEKARKARSHQNRAHSSSRSCAGSSAQRANFDPMRPERAFALRMPTPETDTHQQLVQRSILQALACEQHGLES